MPVRFVGFRTRYDTTIRLSLLETIDQNVPSRTNSRLSYEEEGQQIENERRWEWYDNCWT